MIYHLSYRSDEFIPYIYSNAVTGCLYSKCKKDSQTIEKLRQIERQLFDFDERVMPLTKEEEMNQYLRRGDSLESEYDKEEDPSESEDVLKTSQIRKKNSWN